MLKNIYNQKVTILNKLKKTDSESNLDVWYKSVIEDAAWYEQSERAVTSNGVTIGSYIVCLIPHHKEYLDYTEWKAAGNQDGHFTMSTGDYIILGEVEEDITPNNIVSTMTKYEPRVCAVKHFTPAQDRFGSSVQLRVEGT